MAKSVNISDYKARVKIETATAVKNLETFRKALVKLDRQLNNNTKVGAKRLKDATKVYEQEVKISDTKKEGGKAAKSTMASLIRSTDLYLAKNITLAKLRDRDRKAAERFEKKIRAAALQGNRLEVATLQKNVSLRHQSLSAAMRESAVIANTVHSYSRIAAFASAAAIAMGTIKAVELGKKYDKSVISLQAALASSNYVTEQMDTGDMNEEQRQEFIDKHRKFAYGTSQKYGLDSSAFMSDYARFSVSAMGEGRMTPEQVQLLMQGMAKQSVVFGLTTDETKRALNAFSQMANKGKVSAEELKNQLGDVLPGAMKLFADAMGKTEGELMQMMDRGELLAWDVLPRVASRLNATAEAGGALEKALKEPNKQFDILQSRLSHFAIGTYNQFKEPLSRLIMLITDTVNKIGKPFAEFTGTVLEIFIEDLIDSVKSISETLIGWAEAWEKFDSPKDKIAHAKSWAEDIKSFGKAILYTWGIVKAFAIGSGLATIFTAVSAFVTTTLPMLVGGLMAIFSPVFLTLAGLAYAIAVLMGSEGIERDFDITLPEWVKTFIDAPREWAIALMDGISSMFDSAYKKGAEWAEYMKNMLLDLFPSLPTDWQTIKDTASGVADTAGEAWDWLLGDSSSSQTTNNFYIEAKQENHGEINKEQADRNLTSFQGALTNGFLGMSGADMAATR